MNIRFNSCIDLIFQADVLVCAIAGKAKTLSDGYAVGSAMAKAGGNELVQVSS